MKTGKLLAALTTWAAVMLPCAGQERIIPTPAEPVPETPVIEAVAEPLGRRITEQVTVPTIGIGASAACDGQILVLEDMLGLSLRVPKFVKRFGELGPSIERAVKGYAEEVRTRRFPSPDHVYPMRKPKA